MEYKTIRAVAKAELIEKRSRFLGQIAPVQSDREAMEFLASVREQHREATHHVYAYCLRTGQLQRFSDDGEPQGTAGKPVLEVLLREQLVDVALVVARYFGGILLGAGGLVRAYAQSAKLAVDAAEVLCMAPAVLTALTMDYSFYGKLNNLMPQYEAQVQQCSFEDAIRMRLLLPERRFAAFSAAVEELSAGRVSPEQCERQYAHFPASAPSGR